MKPTILVMFSGGLDSLAALHALVAAPDRDYIVHAHHVDIHNIENRAEAEAIAVRSIRGWYEVHGYTDLQWSSSAVRLPMVNGIFPFDNDITKFIAGFMAAAAEGAVESVAYGVTKTDDEQSDMGDRIKRGTDIYKVFTQTELIYPVRHMTKAEALASLPPDLAKLAWSCRTPSYVKGKPVACGVCKTCKDVAKASFTA